MNRLVLLALALPALGWSYDCASYYGDWQCPKGYVSGNDDWTNCECVKLEPVQVNKNRKMILMTQSPSSSEWTCATQNPQATLACLQELERQRQRWAKETRGGR